MPILVYMRDGRTVYLVPKRGLLGQLMSGSPDHVGPSVRVQRGIWNPTTGEYVFVEVPLRWLAKGSVSHVEEAPRDGS